MTFQYKRDAINYTVTSNYENSKKEKKMRLTHENINNTMLICTNSCVSEPHPTTCVRMYMVHIYVYKYALISKKTQYKRDPCKYF